MGRRVEAHVGFTADEEPSEVVDLAGARARRPPAPARRWRPTAGLLAVVVVAAAAVLAVLLTIGDPSPPPEPDAETALPDVGRVATVPSPIQVDPGLVFGPGLRGTVERYWPRAEERGVVRVHTIRLERPDGSAAVLLQIDATRRAQVRGDGDATAIAGVALPAPTRVFTPVRAGAPARWEWDLPGYGVSMLASGLSGEELARLAAGVTAPDGRSLLNGRQPWVALDVVAALDLELVSRRGQPATTVGAPLIGQAGLEGVEAYGYRATGEDPGSFLLVAARDRAVSARDLIDAFGDRVELATQLLIVEHAAALEADDGQLVGFRVTGRNRLVLDHRSGVVIELASDNLDVAQLAAEAVLLDLEQLVRGLPPPR